MRGIIHLGLVLVGGALVQAQSTQHATCDSGFQWVSYTIFYDENSLPLHVYSRLIRRTKVLAKSLSLLVAFVTVEVRIRFDGLCSRLDDAQSS